MRSPRGRRLVGPARGVADPRRRDRHGGSAVAARDASEDDRDVNPARRAVENRLELLQARIDPARVGVERGRARRAAPFVAGADRRRVETEHAVLERAGAAAIDAISDVGLDALLYALKWYEGGMDFDDALHMAASAKDAAFATFDRPLSWRARNLGAFPPVSLL